MNTVSIKGMSCQHCVASVTKALEQIPGITEISVDLKNGEARFAGTVDKTSVKQAIEQIGFEVTGQQ